MIIRNELVVVSHLSFCHPDKIVLYILVLRVTLGMKWLYLAYLEVTQHPEIQSLNLASMYITVWKIYCTLLKICWAEF